MVDAPPRLSLVVPVYRSEPILVHLVAEIDKAMAAEGFAGDFELILVNDASPDNSWDVIRRLAASHAFVRGVCLRKNFGQHSATMAGLNHVRGAIAVILDDDLQHPPRDISNIVRAIESGYDVCYTRYRSRKHALWKRLGSRFNDRVATLFLKKPSGLYLSSFKGMRRDIVDEVIKYDGPYAYLDGLILEVTRSITSVEIEHQERLEGRGNYNLRRSVSLWLKMTTGFSILPLRIATVAGFGPRFLHSTGQAYKGGPKEGIFLTITREPAQDIAIPGNRASFGTVQLAQARGDMDVLASRGQRVLRVHLKDEKSGPEALARALKVATQN